MKALAIGSYLSGFLIAMLSACAPIPVATTHSYSTQPKMRSVAHWEILAQTTAKKLEASPHMPKGAFYIQGGSGDTPFDQLFATYLTTALTNYCQDKTQSGTCSVSQGHALQSEEITKTCACQIQTQSEPERPYLAYGITRVHHDNSKGGRPPAGLFTLLGAGVWLGHQAAEHWSSATDYLAAAPLGAAIDLLTSTMTAPTHTEVVVSLALVGKDGKIQYRENQSFYVEDTEAAEYPNEPLYLPSASPTVIASQTIGIEKDHSHWQGDP
jgi:hypothetical protein